MTAVAYPAGELTTAADGLLTFRAPLKRLDSRRARAWLDRVRAAKLPDALLPRRVIERGTHLELEYPDETRRTLGFDALAAQWAADPQYALPRLIPAAALVWAFATGLRAAGVADVVLAPGTVRFLPDGDGAWRVAAVPGVGTVVDWARSDPGVWGWAAPSTLVEGSGPDPVRLVGALLHDGLTDHLMPPGLTARERFQRALVGRAGQPARLAAAARRAVPDAMAVQADALAAFVGRCLHPDAARRPTADETAQALAGWGRTFALDELVRRWEADGRRDVAAALRVRQRPPEPEPEPLPTERSWADVAKGHSQEGKFPQALEGARRAVRQDGASYVRLYLGVLQQWAAHSAAAAEVKDALDRLHRDFPQHLAEADHVRVAHLRARYLAGGAAALAALPTKFESVWTEATALLLRASVQMRQRENYALVSRHCTDADARFAAAPGHGGPAGTYARAYLKLLDGIAHIEYAGATGLLDYYADALTRLTDCVTFAARLPAADLVDAGVGWLALLAKLARISPDANARNVYLGATAVLGTFTDAAKALADADVPVIPPFDDGVIFPPF